MSEMVISYYTASFFCGPVIVATCTCKGGMCSPLEFTILCSMAVTSEKRLHIRVIFKIFSSRKKGGQVKGEAPGRFAVRLNFRFAL